MNRFIDRWELERLLFPVKPADHMYACTLLDHWIRLFFKLKFPFRSAVTFKVHSNFRHFPPHKMSCLYCKAQKGHKSCCIDIKYRPEVFQSILLYKFEEIKWFNCQHGSQLPTKTVAGYNNLPLTMRWTCADHQEMKHVHCLDALSHGMIGPTLKLGSYLTASREIRKCPSRHRCIRHTAEGAPKSQLLLTNSALLWITGEEKSVCCRKTLKSSPRQVSSAIKCWCDSFWRDVCCFGRGSETKRSWFTLKNKAFGFIGGTRLFMMKMKWRE